MMLTLCGERREGGDKGRWEIKGYEGQGGGDKGRRRRVGTPADEYCYRVSGKVKGYRTRLNFLGDFRRKLAPACGIVGIEGELLRRGLLFLVCFCYRSLESM